MTSNFDTLIKYKIDFIGHLLFDTYEVRVVSLFPSKDHEDYLVEFVNAKKKTELKFVYYPNTHVKKAFSRFTE